jgi:tetratricopeptide (TPR) repeat protein
MSATSPTFPIERRKPSRWSKRFVLVGLAIIIATALIFGRDSAAGWFRLSAARQVEEGAVAAAQQSLAWARWLSDNDHATDLLQAACFRRLGEIDAWRTSLDDAQRHRAPPEKLQLEEALGNLRWGQVERVAPGDYDVLVAAGAAPRDAMHAVVHGLLAKGARSEALEMLEGWDLSAVEPAEASFLRGVCTWSAGNLEMAQEEFERTLEYQPDHDMAHAGLARLLEDQHRYREALVHDVWLAGAAPGRESTRVDLARTLRKMARVSEARRVLGSPALSAATSDRLALELAELEFETGNYEAAREWFDKANLERPHAPETLRAAACNLNLLGEPELAEQLRTRVDDSEGLVRRADELKRRLGIDPSDLVAAQELEQVSQRNAARLEQRSEQVVHSEMSPLFMRHCAGCHGADGSAHVRSVRFLHPRPRNLRTGRYRLISTTNQVPSRNDIERVIREGMPGSSMPSFANLTEGERGQLAREVELLYRERFREAAIPPIEPAETLPAPIIAKASNKSIERGKHSYFRSGCHHCHGENGTAATAPLLIDEDGQATAPRNLVFDPMKGGPQAESLYRRIRLGMPGTPHPASPSLSDVELVELVHFCQSLAREPKQQLTNHQREMRAVHGEWIPIAAGPASAN